MKVLHKIMLLLILLGIAVVPAYAESAQKTFDRCVGQLKGAKTIKADFVISAQGVNNKGTLVAKGNRFALEGSSFGSWYDGKEMWTYNNASKQITVWEPTPSELAESNPLMYLSSARDYTVAKAGNAAKGEIRLTLTPRKRNTGIKLITLTLNAKTYLPKSMKISTGSGEYNLSVSNLRLGADVNDSAFKFPASRYPQARIERL